MSIISTLKNRLFNSKSDKSSSEAVDAPAKHFMIHRNDIIFIYNDFSLQEVHDAFRTSKQTLLPVCKDNSNNIIGAYSIYTLLDNIMDNKAWNYNLSKTLEPTLFISGYTNIFLLHERMIQDKQPLAIIVNEFGSIEGILNINSILLSSDYKLDTNSNVFYGKTLLSDLIDIIDFSNLEYTSTTLGGLLVEYLGRLPDQNEEIIINNYAFKILEISSKSIQKIAIEKK